MRRKKLVGILSLIFILCIIISFAYSHESYNNNSTTQTEQYFFITDNYGLPDYMSFNEILERKDVNADLKQMYQALKSEEGFKYIEMFEYFLQYKGKYNNGNQFVENPNNMYDKVELNEVIEQRCLVNGKEELLTNIYGFFMGKDEFNDFLSDRQLFGRGFRESDYIIDGNKINVILGYNYHSLYNIGDEFHAYYMGEEFKLKIIGILDKNVNIDVGIEPINVDKYVLLPSFDAYKNNKLKSIFQGMHYFNKTEGLIKNIKKISANELVIKFKKIVDNANLSFNCMPLEL